MSATYRILPERGLVYVRYEGFVTMDQSVAVIGGYINDPARRPGQMQLVDLSAVTGFEFDFVRLMALQAQKAGIFLDGNDMQTLLVYYAPHDEGYEMAKLILRSWQGVPAIMATIQRHESEALDILGQPERRMDELLSAAG